jgi:RimJ/RimL family protein N-acetyltransferase
MDVWVGERVRLRGIEPGDWAGFREFDRDSAVQRSAWLIMPPRSQEGYRHWAAEQAVAKPEGDIFQLAIETLDGSILVGAISTIEARPSDGYFAYGVVVGREHQRRGYGREAVLLLLRFMFAERRYAKCTVGVYASNAPSLDLHNRLGFTDEGRIRRYRYAGGQYEDLVYFGITAEEFGERYPKLTHLP